MLRTRILYAYFIRPEKHSTIFVTTQKNKLHVIHSFSIIKLNENTVVKFNSLKISLVMKLMISSVFGAVAAQFRDAHSINQGGICGIVHYFPPKMSGKAPGHRMPGQRSLPPKNPPPPAAMLLCGWYTIHKKEHYLRRAAVLFRRTYTHTYAYMLFRHAHVHRHVRLVCAALAGCFGFRGRRRNNLIIGRPLVDRRAKTSLADGQARAHTGR